MCGIAALFKIKQKNKAGLIKNMVDMISHRGPDDEGYVLLKSLSPEFIEFLGGDQTPEECYKIDLPYAPKGKIRSWDDDTVDIAFGHRRLSIIDLSPGGHQPMCTEDSRYIIVYNGEIYNYREIRGELINHGYRFTSKSDTEIILNSYRKWGKNCLQRFNGMFAFVLYDRLSGHVFAARDRYGVKPLYYWISPDGCLSIVSEIKQFRVFDGWKARLNAQRAFDFLSYGLSDHTEETLFSDVKQLRGGEYLECQIDDIESSCIVKRWYTLSSPTFEGNAAEAAEKFKELFYDSVELRLRADVMVGTGLSGGLDSSSIVCAVNELLLKAGINNSQNTFSSCSHISEFDERQYIDEIVRYTGVNAHYVYPDPNELFDDLNNLVWYHDEPFSSTSVYAEWRVFQTVADTTVKVTLDGHGADELLAGYHSYFGPQFARLFTTLNWLKLYREIQATKRLHGYGYGFAAAMILNVLLPEFLRQPSRHFMGESTNMIDWINTKAMMIDEADPNVTCGTKTSRLNELSEVQLLYTSIPQQLRWCDRDSMAHSIESRAPYLDYRLVEFTLGCPAEYKLSKGTTKKLMREAMAEILPEKIQNRMDKMGFVTPEEIWIRYEAKDQFRDAVKNAVEQSCGVLNDRCIEKSERIIKGEEKYDYSIWKIISFGNWMEQFNIHPNLIR